MLLICTDKELNKVHVSRDDSTLAMVTKVCMLISDLFGLRLSGQFLCYFHIFVMRKAYV